jgi:hypothetical protein
MKIDVVSYVSPKRRHLPTSENDVITQKTNIDFVTASNIFLFVVYLTTLFR